jgi:hypothetical protein
MQTGDLRHLIAYKPSTTEHALMGYNVREIPCAESNPCFRRGAARLLRGGSPSCRGAAHLRQGQL